MTSRRAIRHLFRAVREHDRRPAFKSLFPLQHPAQYFPWCHADSPPLAVMIKHAFRRNREMPGLDSLRSMQSAGALAVLEATEVLDRNIRRENFVNRDDIARALANCSRKPHPNLHWFYRRMESKHLEFKDLVQDQGQSPTLGQAEILQVRGQDMAVLLMEMASVGCTPPRRMLLQTIDALASSPTTYELALRVFWFMELRTGHMPCGSVTQSLVSGAMGVAAAHPPHSQRGKAGQWRTLGILEVLAVAPHVYPPNETVVNKVLSQCATISSSLDELQRVENAVAAANLACVTISGSTYNALMKAWDKMGHRKQCTDIVIKMREKGLSPDAETMLSLYQWSIEEGDLDDAGMLEAELLGSGKAAYLAALSSPQC